MECPKCGVHIGRFELDQTCKNCGVNIFYYQQEKLLSTDAKKCELEYASFRVFVAKLKTAFIKGKLPIARLIFTLLCIAALLVPFGTLKVSLPLFEHSLSFGGIGIYKSFSDGSLLALLDFAKIGVSQELASKALLLLASVILILLADLLILFSELLSFINIRRSSKAMAVFSVLGILFSAFAFITSFIFSSSDSAFTSGAVNSSLGYGSIVCALMFVGMLIINILFIKKKIVPEFKEVDLQRIQMRKRVKRGEVSLDDLPLPVFESEEEKAKRLEEARAEEERMAVSANG